MNTESKSRLLLKHSWNQGPWNLLWGKNRIISCLFVSHLSFHASLFTYSHSGLQNCRLRIRAILTLSLIKKKKERKMKHQYQKLQWASCVATSCFKYYSASHPHGLHQICHVLLWDVSLLFHQSICKFSNTSGGTYGGYLWFATARTISCPFCLPVALS